MADFTPANSEFDRQARILLSLTSTISVSARQDGSTLHYIGGEQLPILDAGAQNTMAASAIVLLAAHFEEYIRQQIAEYADGIISEFSYFDLEFQSKIVDVYWRGSLGRMGRIRPKDDPAWQSMAGTLLANTIRYPIEGDTSQFLAAIICDHDNNMRLNTILELCGRVGIKKLSDRLFKDSAFKALVGVSKRDDFAIAVRGKLNEFYELRNGIVHSISQNSGVGLSVFEQWIRFFIALTTAFARACEASFSEFEAEMATKKARAAAATASAPV